MLLANPFRAQCAGGRSAAQTSQGFWIIKAFRIIKRKSRANPKADAAMAVLLLGGPTPNGYAARRTSFNATLSFAFRFLTR